MKLLSILTVLCIFASCSTPGPAEYRRRALLKQHQKNENQWAEKKAFYRNLATEK